MPCLKREQLTAKRPVPRERVELPELGQGVYVWVHGFTARERERFLAKFRGKNANNTELQESFDARRAVEACRDDDGNQVFSEADIQPLMDQPSGLINRLADAWIRMDTGETQLDLAKNSDAATPDGE